MTTRVFLKFGLWMWDWRTGRYCIRFPKRIPAPESGMPLPVLTKYPFMRVEVECEA